MRSVARRVSAAAYKHAVKPVLFRFAPDSVHRGMVQLTQIVQKVPVLRASPRMWAYQNKSMLSQKMLGLTFRNPIGLSAGFDKGIETVPIIEAVGFGWMTGGSVTWGKYKGNDGAWFFRLPKSKSLVVHAGLPSTGTLNVARHIEAYSPRLFTDFPLNVSVAMTNSKVCASTQLAISDYCKSLKHLDGLVNVGLHEINISCPNTFGGEPFTTPGRLEQLLKAVDDLKLEKPVFIKMPINLEINEFDSLLKVIIKHTIAGVAIGNLQKDRRKVVLQDELPDSVKGSLSGAPTRNTSTELIRFTYKKYHKKLLIIGIGGVFSAKDAYEKIQAGASLVGLITGMIFEGPQLIGEINHGLVALLKRDGYENISEAIGTKVV